MEVRTYHRKVLVVEQFLLSMERFSFGCLIITVDQSRKNISKETIVNSKEKKIRIKNGKLPDGNRQ